MAHTTDYEILNFDDDQDISRNPYGDWPEEEEVDQLEEADRRAQYKARFSHACD